MDHRIVGTTLPVLEIQLAPGESVVAVSGEFSWMSQSIQLNTTTGNAGLGGLLQRIAGGGSIFMTEYSAQGAPGIIAFATKMPGSILPVDVAPGSDYMIHRHGFLCGTDGVQVTVGFQQSLGAGIFGGNGFILQKVSGTGQAWIELDGEVVPYTLAAGETLRVHPGHVGMFDSTVQFDITRIQGIRNMLFGSDGIFLAALTGPGRVWLQSLPLANLAHALIPYLPTPADGAAEVGTGAIAGSLLRGLMKS